MRKNYEDDIIAHIDRSDGIRYERIDGIITKVSEPDVSHGYACSRLLAFIIAYALEHDLGPTFSHDTLFLFKREPRTIRGPDLVFIAKARMPDEMPRGIGTIIPDLTVEILSPSQRLRMMQRKVADYLEAGVRLVWVVDFDKQTVVRYRRGETPVTLGASDVLDGEDVLPGFRRQIGEICPKWSSRR